MITILRAFENVVTIIDLSRSLKYFESS